ncbi:hypothetical protein GCM10027187_37770 [Streptosporangium sandarakinum]
MFPLTGLTGSRAGTETGAKTPAPMPQAPSPSQCLSARMSPPYPIRLPGRVWGAGARSRPRRAARRMFLEGIWRSSVKDVMYVMFGTRFRGQGRTT